MGVSSCSTGGGVLERIKYDESQSGWGFGG